MRTAIAFATTRRCVGSFFLAVLARTERRHSDARVPLWKIRAARRARRIRRDPPGARGRAAVRDRRRRRRVIAREALVREIATGREDDRGQRGEERHDPGCALRRRRRDVLGGSARHALGLRMRAPRGCDRLPTPARCRAGSAGNSSIRVSPATQPSACVQSLSALVRGSRTSARRFLGDIDDCPAWFHTCCRDATSASRPALLPRSSLMRASRETPAVAFAIYSSSTST